MTLVPLRIRSLGPTLEENNIGAPRVPNSFDAIKILIFNNIAMLFLVFSAISFIALSIVVVLSIAVVFDLSRSLRL